MYHGALGNTARAAISPQLSLSALRPYIAGRGIQPHDIAAERSVALRTAPVFFRVTTFRAEPRKYVFLGSYSRCCGGRLCVRGHHLHGDGASSLYNAFVLDVFGDGPNDGHRVYTGCLKKRRSSNGDAGDEFFRNVFIVRETPLSIGGDAGAQQVSVFIFEHIGM